MALEFPPLNMHNISNKVVLAAMNKVPRHCFVPYEYQDMAYDDCPLNIGYGQTISQPYIVALMTSMLQLTNGCSVLEIGTGSGYQTAILAEIVSRVYTVELIEPLSDRAQKTLHDLGYSNIKYKVGDGYYGWLEHSPFDAIMVTAAISYIPKTWIAQLKDGGRLIVPIRQPNKSQYLVLVTKRGNELIKEEIARVRFVPFRRAM